MSKTTEQETDSTVTGYVPPPNFRELGKVCSFSDLANAYESVCQIAEVLKRQRDDFAQQRDTLLVALRDCQTSEWSLTFASPNRPSPISRLAEINKIARAAIALAEGRQS